MGGSRTFYILFVAGKYYAITPKIKAKDDYDMLKKIKCEQYWVLTNKPPGRPGWRILQIFEKVAKP